MDLKVLESIFSPYDVPTWPLFTKGRHGRDEFGGCYAALSKGEVLYVGISHRVRSRVTAHKANPWYRLLDKSVEWRVLPDNLIPSNQAKRQFHEALMIEKYRPRGNFQAPKFRLELAKKKRCAI